LPKRLNRNALTVAAALGGVTVLTVLVVSGPSHNRAATIAAPADRVPPMPARPTFLDQPPRLPAAALAGSPGSPIAERSFGMRDGGRGGRSQSSAVGMESDARHGEESIRTQAYHAALLSGLLVGSREGEEEGEGAGDAAARPAPVDQLAPARGLPYSPSSTTALGAPPVALHADVVDSDTTASLAADSDRSTASRFTLRAGTVIPGTLLTGITSDVPGAVIGQISRDVFDSRTQQLLLIPKGSRLIGTYDSRSVRTGRLIVEWTRLLFPDGRSIALERSEATDETGQSGMHDQVNHHVGRLFGTALLLSAITAGVQLSQPQQATVYGVPSASQVAAGALGQQMGEIGIESARRGLDTPPTVTIRPGWPFDVLLTNDITFDGTYVAAS
jgi:type IV secretory pathway VirB10-like protein